MRLIQMRFSHNCVKVRLALERKGLAYDTQEISPLDRGPVVAASGQRLVPALVDGGRSIADSTAILRYLEEAYPQRSLLPDDPGQHASCWLIEDWADGAFMELSRRTAYWQRIRTPGALVTTMFPKARGWRRWVLVRRVPRVLTKRFGLSAERNAQDEKQAPRLARLALDRLAGRPWLFGERASVADVGLAAMVAPLHLAARHVREDPAVGELLAWARPVLGDEITRLYVPT